jgi:hypothetical protein
MNALLALALALAPPGLEPPRKPTLEPEPLLAVNRAAAPWMSLSISPALVFMPFLDVSLRPRAAIGILWDALELGGTAIVGFNFVQRFVGGGPFVNWTPVPYRWGYIVYTHVGVGRLHTDDPYLGRRHMDYLRFALGFRIPMPRDELFIPWVEVGYQHLRRCADWSIPCGFGGWGLWAPLVEFGLRFR